MHLFQPRIRLPTDDDEQSRDSSVSGLCGCLPRGGGVISLPEDPLYEDNDSLFNRMNPIAGQIGQIEEPSLFLASKTFAVSSPYMSFEEPFLSEEPTICGGDTETHVRRDSHQETTNDYAPDALEIDCPTKDEEQCPETIVAAQERPSLDTIPFIVTEEEIKPMVSTIEAPDSLAKIEQSSIPNQDEVKELMYSAPDGCPTPPASLAAAETPVSNIDSQFPATSITRIPFVNVDTGLPKENDTLESQNTTLPINPRPTSSVAAVAHSILGDKLDDFTEKLAFIKRNIIMNYDDSDDESNIYSHDNEPLSPVHQPRRRPSFDPILSVFGRKENDGERRHRRTRSLMDVAGPSIARFVNQFGAGESKPGDSSSSPSSLSPVTALAGPAPASEIRQQYRQPPLNEEGEEDEDGDEEELFDFSKVIALGKNVRTFSEGVMGNGIRMFNDVATRVKNASQNDSNGYMLGSEPYL